MCLMKSLLGMLLLCACLVHAQGATFSYTPGIYDDSIEVNHIVSDVVYLEIEQQPGNKVYDWITFVPKSKTKIIEDYDGSETVEIRWNIPKSADIGNYEITINAYDEDNRHVKTYDIELVVESKHFKTLSGFIFNNIDFGLFKLNVLTLLLGGLGIIGTIIIIKQVKEFFENGW